jgi:hypothetical protein
MGEWVKLFRNRDFESIKKIKPIRQAPTVDIDFLIKVISTSAEDVAKKLTLVLRVEEGEMLMAVSEDARVSKQSIMKYRRQVVAGELPKK